jgi:hypothetical protein
MPSRCEPPVCDRELLEPLVDPGSPLVLPPRDPLDPPYAWSLWLPPRDEPLDESRDPDDPSMPCLSRSALSLEPRFRF